MLVKNDKTIRILVNPQLPLTLFRRRTSYKPWNPLRRGYFVKKHQNTITTTIRPPRGI